MTAGDEAAFFALYSEVRAGELHLDAAEPALRDRVLRSQFEAQRRGYREQFPAAADSLILSDGIPIGWVIVEAGGRDLHVIDIAVVARERSRGVGTHVIRTLQREAAAGGRRVVVTVQRFNLRARSLYERLGFRLTKETDTHVVMESRQE